MGSGGAVGSGGGQSQEQRGPRTKKEKRREKQKRRKEDKKRKKEDAKKKDEREERLLGAIETLASGIAQAVVKDPLKEVLDGASAVAFTHLKHVFCTGRANQTPPFCTGRANQTPHANALHMKSSVQHFLGRKVS